VPHLRTDGARVANDFTDMLDCPGVFGSEDCFDAPISTDENGVALPSLNETRTGTRQTGMRFSYDDCGGWTDSISGVDGRTGSVSHSNSFWTSERNNTCDQSRRLFCFED